MVRKSKPKNPCGPWFLSSWQDFNFGVRVEPGMASLVERFQYGLRVALGDA